MSIDDRSHYHTLKNYTNLASIKYSLKFNISRAPSTTKMMFDLSTIILVFIKKWTSPMKKDWSRFLKKSPRTSYVFFLFLVMLFFYFIE